MLESAIESLARSGRTVRIREIALGYLPAGRTLLSGALAALALTYVRYYWWAATASVSAVMSWIGNRELTVGVLPEFHVLVYGPEATAYFLAAGALLAAVRRWGVRHGRFLVLQAGAIAEFRAGWHVPIGMLLAALLTLRLSFTFFALPPSFAYVLLAAAALAGIIAWEIAHDLLLPLLLSAHERRRAAVEYDLKEALVQDETAVRWSVARVRYHPETQTASLTGEFPSVQARRRAEQVARRVQGVASVELIDLEPEQQPAGRRASGD